MPGPLALTMGEPAGIGGELTLSAWRNRGSRQVPAFVVLDDPERLRRMAVSLDWDVPIREVASSREAESVFPSALPVLSLPTAVAAVAGLPDPRTASATIASIDQAVVLVQQGDCAALVTNPIQKSVLYSSGFHWPGHTEYLAHLAGMTDEPVMMLVGGGLRVALVTIHLPLRAVPDTLTIPAIQHTARITASALRRDFGIARPRLAVAALNPHAGEAGTIGDEEQTIIGPAVEALRQEGLTVDGPLPADTLFHAGARVRYDAVVCLYHDQALIPLKTLDFATGVNVTLGLPFIRTSPDHGTALDIAGTGRADNSSLIAALQLARQMADGRAGGREV
jgi:4-hydroxythreonine-4-phosphate dehydrogenase